MTETKKAILPGINLLRDYTSMTATADEKIKAALTIENVFKEQGIDAVISGVKENALYIQFLIKVGEAQLVKEIRDLRQTISSRLGYDIDFDEDRSILGINILKNETGILGLKELIRSEAFESAHGKINFAVGTNMQGEAVVTDLADMPNLVVGGTTGSGKSVFLDCMITSMLYKYSPEELQLVLIGTREGTFGDYRGLPHLLTPVITTCDRGIDMFDDIIDESFRRYELLEKLKVRNADEYNERVKRDPSLGEPMKQVVVIIDDIADMMRYSSDEMQKATVNMTLRIRAAGMHLVYVTQYPDKNTLTPNIKYNLVGKAGFRVATSVESNMIFGGVGLSETFGAEKLQAQGEMLFYRPGYWEKKHIIAPYISPEEVKRVVEDIKSKYVFS